MLMHAAFNGCHDGSGLAQWGDQEEFVVGKVNGPSGGYSILNMPYLQSRQQQQQQSSSAEISISFTSLSTLTASARDGIISQMEMPQIEKLKNEAKQILIKYDKNFQEQHNGRLPTKEEKEPIRHIYDTYKSLRNEALRKEGHKRLLRLRIEKWELKEQLKEYDKIFAMSNGGRDPTPTERGPIRSIYEKYKLTKDEIKRLEKTEEQAKVQKLMQLQKEEKKKSGANMKWEETYPQNEDSNNTDRRQRGETAVTFQNTSSSSSSSSYTTTSLSSSPSTDDNERPRGEVVSKYDHNKIMQQRSIQKRDKKASRQTRKEKQSLLKNHRHENKAEKNLSNSGRDETCDLVQHQHRNDTHDSSSPTTVSTNPKYRHQHSLQQQQQQQQTQQRQQQKHYQVQSNDDVVRDLPPSHLPVGAKSSKMISGNSPMGATTTTPTTSTTTTSATTSGKSKFEEFGRIVVLGSYKKDKKATTTKVHPNREKTRKEKYEEGNAKRKLAMRNGVVF